jgi:hypothetical protein
VPKLQKRKGSSCEFFFFFADIKAPNNSNFGPISPRKKQFRNKKKERKQESPLDKRQDTKNPSAKATAIRELGARRRRRRRRRGDGC